MRLRVALGHFVIRLGRFIQSLAPAVMKPDDLLEFSRLSYNQTHAIDGWTSDEVVNAGLAPEEQELLERVPLTAGRLLVLGLGGGREALVLARRGFEVVGVDYVPEMVQRATEHGAREGLRIEGLVRDYSRLEAPAESFDLAVLLAGMYSGIPTRRKRVRMLQAIARSLRPGGYFVCQFQFDPQVNPRSARVRKAVAFLSLGNFWFEAGDTVWGAEFIHNFSSSEELRAEFTQGGFLVTYFPDLNQSDRYGAVLQKPA